MKTFDHFTKPMMLVMALLLVAMAAGAFEDSSGQVQATGTVSVSSIAPTVTAVAPLANATGVPINTKIITAAFSKPMNPVTLTNASFTLSCAGGMPVTGAVTYLAAGNVATLTLPAATTLPPSTVCTATVSGMNNSGTGNIQHENDNDSATDADHDNEAAEKSESETDNEHASVTTGVRDATGIPLASNFAWTFTTGVTPDTIHPRVELAVPVVPATPATPAPLVSLISPAAASTLLVGGPGAAFPQSVILINGAQAKNVFWKVGSAATINAGGGGTMVGTIISPAGTTFSTAGNATPTTLNGRVLSTGASVTMVNTIINVPAP